MCRSRNANVQKYKRINTTTALQTKITAREYLVLFHTQLTDQTNEWMNKPNKKSTTTTNLFQIKYLRRNSMHGMVLRCGFKWHGCFFYVLYVDSIEYYILHNRIYRFLIYFILFRCNILVSQWQSFCGKVFAINFTFNLIFEYSCTLIVCVHVNKIHTFMLLV